MPTGASLTPERQPLSPSIPASRPGCRVTRRETRKSSSHLSETHEPSHMSGHVVTPGHFEPHQPEKMGTVSNGSLTRRYHPLHCFQKVPELSGDDSTKIAVVITNAEENAPGRTETGGRDEKAVANRFDQRAKQGTSKTGNFWLLQFLLATTGLRFVSYKRCGKAKEHSLQRQNSSQDTDSSLGPHFQNAFDHIKNSHHQVDVTTSL